MWSCSVLPVTVTTSAVHMPKKVPSKNTVKGFAEKAQTISKKLQYQNTKLHVRQTHTTEHVEQAQGESVLYLVSNDHTTNVPPSTLLFLLHACPSTLTPVPFTSYPPPSSSSLSPVNFHYNRLHNWCQQGNESISQTMGSRLIQIWIPYHYPLLDSLVEACAL